MSTGKNDWTHKLLNWEVKGLGIFLVILVIQWAFSSFLHNFGIDFTMQLPPPTLDLMTILSLGLSALGIGVVGAFVFKFVDDDLFKMKHGSFAISRLVRPKSRRAITKDAKAIIVVLIILGAGYYAYENGYLNTTGHNNNNQQQGTYSYPATITLAVQDGLAGGLVSPSSVLIYSNPSSGASIDSITLSSGKGTSGLATYTSGQTYWVKIVDATTKVLSWQSFTVPYSTSITAPSTWPIALSIENPSATVTITATINGTAQATGVQYNVTGQGNLNPTLMLQIVNPTDNRGLVPTPGPDLGISQWELGAYFLLGNDSAATASINGGSPTFMTRMSSTDVRYYETLPSGPNNWGNAMGNYDRQKNPDGTYKGSGGTITVPVSFNMQGLTAGGNCTCTVKVYGYTSSQWYLNHGFLYGPSAVLLGTYVINFAA